MPETAIYAHTYWNQKGKYPLANKALHKLIPSQGEVPNHKQNPALEKLRVASNCYYDLYNNGLGNRAAEFREVFGFCAAAVALGEDGAVCDHEPDEGGVDEFSQELVDRTESTMDKIIEQAAKEQGIPLDDSPEMRYKKALEDIASMWPNPGMCAELVPKHVWPNDGRMRADTLWYALNAARTALGKPTYPRPEHWDKAGIEDAI